MFKATSAATSSIENKEDIDGKEDLVTLERFRSFKEYIDGLSKQFRETIDAVISSLESSRDDYKQIRVAAITGTGSIIIPILLALAALGVAENIVSIAIIFSAFSIAVTGVITLWTSFKIHSLENRVKEVRKGFSYASVALDVFQNNIRGTISQKGIITESYVVSYYNYLVLLNSAIRHWIIHIAREDWSSLDEPMRRVFEEQARAYCLNKEEGFWSVIETDFAKNWQRNPIIDTIVQEYRCWCEHESSVNQDEPKNS